MADSLIDVKRRIESTKKTSKITSAMRLVSAAKLGQIGDSAKDYGLYSKKLKDIVTDLVASHLINDDSASSVENDNEIVNVHDLFNHRETKRVGYLVISSDRGLVGSYNSSVLKEVINFVEKKGDNIEDAAFLCVGKVGSEFLEKRFHNVVYSYENLSDIPTYKEAEEILHAAVNMYMSSVYDELYVCYNHSVNTLVSEFNAVKMLPINNIDVSESKVNADMQYLIEPDLDDVIDSVLPQYVMSLIYGAILDAKTSEHSSSMTAMKGATDNADKIINKLTRKYNRARQAQITTEITEIVSGANALQ